MVDPDSQWDGRYFDPEKATQNWEELGGQRRAFGPFDSALDFFGDGSFWVINAPGHMPGNLCAAARLESGDWVLLGGDCCHSRYNHILYVFDSDRRTYKILEDYSTESMTLPYLTFRTGSRRLYIQIYLQQETRSLS
jgi:glyoxylase-like metal-dependent hydrolase (beta-lactamase superfamily II)